MKKLLMTLMIISSTAFAGETDLWLKVGAGMGFSNWNDSQEKHDNSQMIFGGIRPSYVDGKMELSLSLDLMQYNIVNDIKNHPTHRQAKHENANVMLSISPKYIMDEHWRVGPYLGKFMDRNHVKLDKKMQDVAGIEVDYRMNHKWMSSLAIEESIDSSARHRVAKLSIAYNFGEKKKAPVASAPRMVCEEEVHVVHFAFDKDKVSDEEIQKVMSFISGKGKVMVRGHADERGSDDYNYDLAKRRALNVIGLIENHVESMEILGEKESTGEGHKMDRRVEIIKKCR